MNAFDDLGLDDVLVEALAAEGIERPTAFQAAALPLIRRGNNVVGLAGPGAGCLVTYGAGLLDRLDAESGPGRVLVLTPTAEAAQRNAESLARLAVATGHSVAALGSPWVLPERASILFGAPAHVTATVRASNLKLDALEALVVDGAAAMVGLGARADLEQILEFVPQEAQRVVLSAPMSDEVTDLVGRHVRKAVHVPPRPVDGQRPETVRRGTLRYAVAGQDKLDDLLRQLERAFGDDARHVLVFFASDDRAADGGDFLTLHGFDCGAPGDPAAPVWLGVDELSARAAQKEYGDPEDVRVISVDVPGDPDSLDRRHAGAGGTILVLPRELPHLKETAYSAGYDLVPAPDASPTGVHDRVTDLRKRIERAVESGDHGGPMLILEPLFDKHAPVEVAAALLTLLQEGSPAAAPEVRSDVPVPSWTRLFVSVGSKDGVGPGDLVGAISGEAGVTGEQVGKIEIRDTFSLVEVERAAADRVIRALNGTTLRGRSARVDFDRGSRGGSRPSRGKSPPQRRRGGGQP